MARSSSGMRYSRARSTKTGLKLQVVTEAAGTIDIREQDPLKQGLKHAPTSLTIFAATDSRARSTKTRIETMETFRIHDKYRSFASKIH